MSSSTQFPNGVITAAVTPMTSKLEADTEMLIGHCEDLLSSGSDGIVLLGTTGEGNSFSVAERMTIAEALVHGGISPEVLMAGTGCCSIADTVTLTSHALELGIRNVLMLPPFYYKPVSDDALFRYFAQVIEQVGSDDLSVYLYHIPKNTGVDLSIDLIGRLHEEYPRTIIGIKDSGGNWEHIQTLIKTFPDFRVYSGTEEYLIETLDAGGVGCISATSNVTISCLTKLMRAYRAGYDIAELQGLANALRHAFDGVPFVGAIKGYLALETQNERWHYLRPPNEPLELSRVSSIHENCMSLFSQSRSTFQNYV